MSIKRVLVVDDSATIRTIVRATFDVHAPKGSIAVVEAGSADEALEALRGGAALMLLDWNMPKVDGLMLVEKIRKQNKTLPIVMITAMADHEHEAKAFAAGVDDYVTKPFQMAELWKRIERHLR
jgi:DNA-binding response OmpR family regulator